MNFSKWLLIGTLSLGALNLYGDCNDCTDNDCKALVPASYENCDCCINAPELSEEDVLNMLAMQEISAFFAKMMQQDLTLNDLRENNNINTQINIVEKTDNTLVAIIQLNKPAKDNIYMNLATDSSFLNLEVNGNKAILSMQINNQ